MVKISSDKVKNTVSKKGRGRPKGTTKVAKVKEEVQRMTEVMNNGQINHEKIFLFVKKETIPKDQLERFLKLCDSMIQSLGASDITDTDLEEIALYYRDRIYIDSIYEEFAENDATDTGLISQIEKLNKGLEQRKVNLGARFIDKGSKRKILGGGETIVDLVTKFDEERAEMQQDADNKRFEIQQNKKTKFTKLEEYMESIGVTKGSS
jgi:hypothetical protein